MAPVVFQTGRLACQFVLSCLTAAGADDPVTRWDMRLPMDASIYRALEEMLGKSAGDEVKLEESGSLKICLNAHPCPPVRLHPITAVELDIVIHSNIMYCNYDAYIYIIIYIIFYSAL